MESAPSTSLPSRANQHLVNVRDGAPFNRAGDDWVWTTLIR